MEDKEAQYEHIEKLVKSFQEGSVEAGFEMVRLFGYAEEPDDLSGFIKKYFNLLRYGVINFRDRDTRGFIRLSTADEQVKQALIPGFQYAETKKAARKIVQRMNDRMQFLNDTELIHELCYVLLYMAKRYKKKSPKKNFCGFLYSSYKFYAHNHFRNLFKDPSLYSNLHEGDEFIEHDDEIELQDQWYLDLYFERESLELGLNWILGKTATFPFSILTPFERTLLSLYDEKGYTYEEVGERMGYHRDTIWNKRKQIKQKLESAMKEPPC
ncbi:sigma factor-like helix-turn-helix DNA-binding protein [Cytobacillus oceanisediminis]|uniref:sigma factor-like helix-turn-helix DNA-binding protein n=1 Tax=Cytobacillus oceanisediminis TaxID=665099 RepID=UPI001FB3544C|nr:sigma factor-like helix-turn-helix DNA-binding protein [Cytobacillus oceanisediminis]UOE58205.1 sigma-70 family RNA polymerase sigma factor [Cytobacillus oceanisediminis]